MKDPFANRSNKQLYREAQVWIAIFSCLLVALLYLVAKRMMSPGDRIPDHILRSGITQSAAPPQPARWAAPDTPTLRNIGPPNSLQHDSSALPALSPLPTPGPTSTPWQATNAVARPLLVGDLAQPVRPTHLEPPKIKRPIVPSQTKGQLRAQKLARVTKDLPDRIQRLQSSIKQASANLPIANPLPPRVQSLPERDVNTQPIVRKTASSQFSEPASSQFSEPASSQFSEPASSQFSEPADDPDYDNAFEIPQTQTTRPRQLSLPDPAKPPKIPATNVATVGDVNTPRPVTLQPSTTLTPGAEKLTAKLPASTPALPEPSTLSTPAGNNDFPTKPSDETPESLAAEAPSAVPSNQLAAMPPQHPRNKTLPNNTPNYHTSNPFQLAGNRQLDTATDQIELAPSIPKTPASIGGKKYVTGQGDSFYSVAQQAYGDGRWFRALHLANRSRVAKYDGLAVGIELALPSVEELKTRFPEYAILVPSSSNAAQARIYTTRSGDTLFDIARRNLGQGSRFVEIIQRNTDRLPESISGSDLLTPEIRLVLPPISLQ